MAMALLMTSLSLSSLGQDMVQDEPEDLQTTPSRSALVSDPKPATADTTIVAEPIMLADREDLILVPPAGPGNPTIHNAGKGAEISLGRRVTFHSGSGYNNPMCHGVPAFSIGISITIF